MNVLIVEPSRTAAYTVSTLFSKHGFEPRVARSGQEALEMLKVKPAELLCFTFELGDMDGIDFFVTAKAHKLVHHQPALMFSATPRKSVINRALMAGVTECFSKRNLDQLEQFVDRFASSSQVSINGKILLVEDSKSSVMFYGQVFERMGLQVDVSPTAEDAIERFAENSYDLVVTDYILAGPQTGFAVIRAVRGSSGKKATIPILAISSFDDMARKVEILRNGADDFVSKPVLAEELEVRVFNMLKLQKLMRRLEAKTAALEASHEKIKMTEEWYRSILHSAPDGMLIVDSNGRIMLVNAQLETMFGYEKGELADCSLEVLMPQAARPSHVDKRNSFFSSEQRERRMAGEAKDLFGCRKDGSVFPVDVSLSRLPDLDGRVGTVCASVRDVSERHKMEVARELALSEALRLAQLRSTFLAQMSHELRTPLNGMLGYAQNLLRDEALGEKQVDGLRIIQHSGEHLLSLINGILDHAAIEADKFQLVPGDIELEQFLGTIIGVIRVRAEQKNIAFTCEADSHLPAVVRGDAQRLRQILFNLLSNAVKFTDKGQVTLRVHYTAPSRLHFAVQDSGIGIAADQLESIFLPFEQVGEISRHAGGSGLGLAISRKIVMLMGSDIKVESKLGAGSTFSFEIEMEAVQAGEGTVNVAALSEQALTSASQEISLLFAPGRQELDILHGLAIRGNMRDVIAYTTRLPELDERYLPFAEHLCQLAKHFQTKALVSLIEQYRNEKEGA